MFDKYRARRAKRKAELTAQQEFFDRLLALFTPQEVIYGPFEREEC